MSTPHDYYGMPVGGGQQHQPVYQTPLPYPPGAYASPPTPAYPGRGKGSYYAPPRMHNTPPPSASRYSSGPYSGRGGGGRRGPTPSTPSSFVHVSVGSAVPSAYNSESDMEPSRFNRSPQYSVWNADPPVNLPQYYNGTAFSPFSGPLGAASDVTDSLDGAQLQMHSSMTLSSGRKHKSKQGIGSRASDAAAEGHSRPSPDNDPPSHPRTANNDVCGTPSTGPINNSSMIEPYQELTEFETDPHRLLQRQKQIIFGKVTEGYRNYAVNVPFFSRREENLMHPLTPRTEVKVSKRRWDTITQDWRRTLHSWDGRTSNTDWIETTDPDLLEDPTDPSIVITREHIRKYADRVAYCLDNLRDHVSAAFGARDGGEEEVLAVPTTATGVQMHHGPVNALQRLTDAQQSLQRRRPGSKPQSPPPATKGSNQQTPETTSLGVAPVAVATHTPRRNGFAVNPLDSATTGRARSPSIHDLSDGDGDESIHAVVTSPAKFKQGAPGPSMPKLTALTVVILNQETQQPMQGFGVSLPGNAESIWSQLSGLFDTSKAWFHMAHRNTNDERPAATATPLGRRTTATPGGSPARHFGLRRGFPSSEEVVPPPCHIHHGECCWIHTLDTADNVSQFLKELPFGLPSVFIYAEALRVSTTDTFWRNATPILIDDTDVQEITFLQRNNLTPDGISTLLDHSAALPTASLFDPSPSPHQVGPNGTRGSIQARLDLTTPVEASPTSSKAAAAGNRA